LAVGIVSRGGVHAAPSVPTRWGESVELQQPIVVRGQPIGLIGW